MRSEQEMLDLILNRARLDDKIRAVILNGSRASASATHDKYSDFDIVYLVDGIQVYTKDNQWYQDFGEILIIQKPDDWYSHSYDYNSDQSFTYLMQFNDGTRIDLKLVDIKNVAELENNEPRIILLDKDNRPELFDMISEQVFNIQKPSEKEFFDCCNEFWWLSVYVAKGLCREEFYYAKMVMEHEMEMLIKMLNWKIGIENDFSVSTGYHSKYLKRFISEEEMQRFMGLFPNGNYIDIWDKLYSMLDYFEEMVLFVSEYFGYVYCIAEKDRIKRYIMKMQLERFNI